MKQKALWFLLAGMVSVNITVAHADSERFREAGKVANVDKQRMVLVIDDSSYYLTPATRIYSQTGQQLPLDVLRPGTNVAFRIELPPGSRKPTIPELVVIPSK